MKLVVNERDTGKRTLTSCTIIFPQSPEYPEELRSGINGGDAFEKRLTAALSNMEVLFVDKTGRPGKLERSALLVDDLRLDAAVIWNHETIRHHLWGEMQPPGLEVIRERLKANNQDGQPPMTTDQDEQPPATRVAQHVRAAAVAQNDAVERLSKASDTAGVRAGAASEDTNERAAAGDAEAGAAAANDDGERPQKPAGGECVGVMRMPQQEMAAVVAGIAKLVTDPEGGDGDGTAGDGDGPAGDGDGAVGDGDGAIGDGDGAVGGGATDDGDGGNGAAMGAAGDGAAGAGDGDGHGANSAAAAARPAPARPRPAVLLRRGETPLNDYDDAAVAIYRTFWTLFPLRQGLPIGQALSHKDTRRLMLHHDNRYALCLPLLYHLANTSMRHAVNKAVNVKVQSHAKAFDAFSKMVTDKDFVELLERAQNNPKGADARQLVASVLPFLTLCGKCVPWGTQERTADMTTGIALHRHGGAGSIFHSLAPDDVHQPLGIRLSYPAKSPRMFPTASNGTFKRALLGSGEERVARDSSGVHFDMREASLQRRTSANPIAATVVFERINRAVWKHLVGLDPARKTTVAVESPLYQKGYAGKCVGFSYVKVPPAHASAASPCPHKTSPVQLRCRPSPPF